MIPLGNVVQYLNDIIDIILVAFVIYNLILLVRGTRAIQLLKGIMVIVSAWLLSTFFKLETLQWLMSQAFNLGVFAILIIFQPELRRALEQLGSGRFFQRLYQGDQGVSAQSMIEIVRACQYMAKRRIGALLVIQRNTGLSEYIETGTHLNANISSELLINIFIPNTPLHDGAVIMGGNQILAAGCYLPLSANPDISKDLGTRHRAGIGISEISDAVVIIVSEETGQISVAMEGSLARDLKEDDLQNLLNSTLYKEKENKGFWQRRGNING